jgi:hypothetical protein
MVFAGISRTHEPHRHGHGLLSHVASSSVGGVLQGGLETGTRSQTRPPDHGIAQEQRYRYRDESRNDQRKDNQEPDSLPHNLMTRSVMMSVGPQGGWWDGGGGGGNANRPPEDGRSAWFLGTRTAPIATIREDEGGEWIMGGDLAQGMHTIRSSERTFGTEITKSFVGLGETERRPLSESDGIVGHERLSASMSCPS